MKRAKPKASKAKLNNSKAKAKAGKAVPKAAKAKPKVAKMVAKVAKAAVKAAKAVAKVAKATVKAAKAKPAVSAKPKGAVAASTAKAKAAKATPKATTKAAPKAALAKRLEQIVAAQAAIKKKAAVSAKPAAAKPAAAKPASKSRAPSAKPAPAIPASPAPTAAQQDSAPQQESASDNDFGAKESSESSMAGPRADFGAPIDGFFETQPPEMRAISEELRRLIEEVAPGAESSLKWGMPFFSFGSGMICAIGGHKAHVNLILSGPPDAFSDPDGRLEGDGKTGRHLKLRSLDDLPRDAVRGWLQKAADLARGKTAD